MMHAHVILRTGLRTGFPTGFAAPAGMKSLGSAFGKTDVMTAFSVGVDQMEADRARMLRREPGVTSVARAVPMRLVEPVTMDLSPAVAPGTAWGVRAVKADTSQSTGRGIVVAVLDTGIDKSHPAFTGVTIVEQDFTGEGNGDVHGHGTHCAGTIFGRDTNGVRTGVARGVTKALIGKVIGKGGGSSDQIVSAIHWALQHGAHVISMSLGIDFPGLVKSLEQEGYPTELATSLALEGYRENVQLFERFAAFVRALGKMTEQPAVLVAAAGNESQRDLDPKFEIAVSPPAVADGFISVAALGETPAGLVIAPFSNTGANLAGPGVGIVSAKPGGGLATMSGTSMATPHVAGVAALWAEKLTNQGAFEASRLTARLIALADSSALKPGFDVGDVGAGLVQAP